MAYAHVAHNCHIENEVIIANSVALAGHIYIESKARISGVLGVHQFVHIGSLAMVGGMSRIERDVPPFAIVEGNPARVRSLNLVGLKRAGLDSEEISQIKKAFRQIYRSDLPLHQALAELEQFATRNPYVQHLRQFLLQSSTDSKRRGSIPSKKRRSQDEI
jgi:UDP-N-acetylglucosamine acyltransferase